MKMEINTSMMPSKQSLMRGKLFRGPTVNAYSRSSISTIPSAVENVLFKKPKSVVSSNNRLFEVQGDSVKLCFHNGLLIDNAAKQSSTVSSEVLNKPKAHCLKPSERFVYDNIQQYYPGPADYSPIHILKSLRYCSLFETEIFQTEPAALQPGPGSYNIASVFDTNVYISPFSRFKKKRVEEYKSKVGPGSYDVSSDLRSKEKEKPSSFFIKDVFRKEEGGMAKYVNYHNDIDTSVKKNERLMKKKRETRGQLRTFADIKEEIIQNKLRESISINNKIKERRKVNRSPLKECECDKFGFPIIDPRKLKGVTMHPSTQSNNSSNKNYVPGPCYYDQPLIPKKIFNANVDNNWLGK